jgi:hypothetical protein
MPVRNQSEEVGSPHKRADYSAATARMGRAKIEGVRERLRSVYTYFTLSEQLLIPLVLTTARKSAKRDNKKGQTYLSAPAK